MHRIQERTTHAPTKRRPSPTVGAREITLGLTFSGLLSLYLLLHIGGAVHLFG